MAAAVKPPRPALVLVVRVDDGPSAVPSTVVTCGPCGAACWLSAYSGASTMALARAKSESGEVVIICNWCIEDLLADGAPR